VKSFPESASLARVSPSTESSCLMTLSDQRITASAVSAERGEVLVRCKPKLARPSEDDIDPGKNCRESRARNFSNALLENLSVERNDLGNVGNGRLCKAGIARRK